MNNPTFLAIIFINLWFTDPNFEPVSGDKCPANYFVLYQVNFSQVFHLKIQEKKIKGGGVEKIERLFQFILETAL